MLIDQNFLGSRQSNGKALVKESGRYSWVNKKIDAKLELNSEYILNLTSFCYYSVKLIGNIVAHIFDMTHSVA
jgi:hypothetical protein